MLKKFIIKKATLITAIIFSLFLINNLPNNKITYKTELEYINNDLTSVVYLLDRNNYLARTEVALHNKKIEEQAKSLLEVLIKGGEGESKIPSGFKSIIPSDVKINSLKYENNLIKIDFSSNLLDTKKEYEEKIIEAIIYTLTSIDGVDKVIIYVNGNILTKLPKTGINLPSTLDKTYGINKEYNLSSYKDVNKTTIYYVSKYNDDSYYVPVTKYTNDNRDKIKIIVDTLSSSNLSNTNLMSYLNSNTVLLSSELNDEALSLVFNEYIFNDTSTKNILEEVIYTINLSIEANYDVKEVIYNVNNEEINKCEIKR